MNKENKTLEEVLVNLDNSSSLLSAIYNEEKKRNKSLSFLNICRKAGIPSTGYFSDTLNGKKRLNIKYKKGVIEALKMKGLIKQLFDLYVERDNCKSEEARIIYETQILKVKNSLSIRLEIVPTNEKNYDWFSLCQTYSSLGILGKRSSLKNILRFFHDQSEDEVKQNLKILTTKNFLKQEGEVYHYTTKHFLLSEKSDSTMSQNFIRKSIGQSLSKLSEFSDKEKHLFMSQVISIDSKVYPLILEKIKASILEYQDELESESASNLAYLNIMITSH